jgi:hypothetical protein
MNVYLVLLVSCLIATTAPAFAAQYNCVPVKLEEENSRLYVECAEPSAFEGGLPRDGNNRIRFFSVRKSDVDFAKRFDSLMQTALISGLVVHFIYPSGFSDNSVGCKIDDCRVPTAVGLLASATGVRIPYVEWPSDTKESIAANEWKRYGPFSISEFRKVVVAMTGTTDADLYVRKDEPPDLTHYDCRPHLPSSSESCVMAPPVDPNNPAASRSTYYVGIKGVADGMFQLKVSIENR